MPVDIATIHRCQQGDEEAFRSIYNTFLRKIHSLAYRYTGDTQEAHDLSQEVFLRIYSHIGTFRGDCSLSTWVYRIAANTISSAHRRSRARERLVHKLERSWEPAQAPRASVDGHELRQEVERAIGELPESLRMAFVLVAMEHRPYAEVSVILGISVEAVRMRVSRARTRLRDALRPYLDEEEGNEV